MGNINSLPTVATGVADAHCSVTVGPHCHDMAKASKCKRSLSRKRVFVSESSISAQVVKGTAVL